MTSSKCILCDNSRSKSSSEKYKTHHLAHTHCLGTQEKRKRL